MHSILGSTRRAELLTLARTWGTALARLHRLPTRFGRPPAARLPWILEPYRLPAHLAASGSPRLRRALNELYGNRTVLAALGEVRAGWTASHWTHGDLTTANVLASRADRAGRAGRAGRADRADRAGRHDWQVWFVDLESAGIGDPSWDLATAYDSLLLQRAALGSAMAPALRALLDGYRTAGGPAQLTRPVLLARASLTAVQLAASPDRSGSRGEPASWDPIESPHQPTPLTTTATRSA
jgi:aminoglycoside phosphotransferase (APT) family kinase protein